ncbi:hypothetical protein [Empedobacter tilapiae]
MNEIRLSKKEIQKRLNSIRIKPEEFERRCYGVSVKYFNGNELAPFKRMDYELSLNLDVKYNQGILEINKSNIYFNQHQPDLINEIIANSISKSIYPIKVELNEKGISPNIILNYNEVLERWKFEKEKLSDKYESDTLTHFFEIVDIKMQQQKQIERNLQNDWFWNLFFHPKLVNYGECRTIETSLFLAVIPYQRPIHFFGIQKIEKIPTNYHSFIITFSSNEQQAPKYFYTINNYSAELPLLIQLEVEYDLDVYHHFPMHVRAKLIIFTKDQLENKTIISRIEFFQYQQNTASYQKKELSLDSPFITGGLVKLPPNKWGFDNFENIENNW